MEHVIAKLKGEATELQQGFQHGAVHAMDAMIHSREPEL